MRRELYASAGIHAAILLWVAIGGSLFRDSDPVEFQVTGVQIISTAEFDAMVQPAALPAPDVPAAPEAMQPAPETEAPAAPEPEATPPEVAQPEETTAPAPEAAPAPAEPAPPDAEVTDEIAALPAPPIGDPSAPPSDRPVPREAPRVAPLPAPVPEPDVETAPDVVEQPTSPDPSDLPSEDVTETAPEEASTEIVTEAEEPAASNAPLASVRPTARPARPAPPTVTETAAVDTPAPATPAPAPEEPPAEDAMADAIAAAVAEAASSEAPPAPSAPAAPSGPPLTRGEVDGLIADVRACWNVGSLSSEAQRTIVTISVQMARDGRPEAGTIRMLGFEGGSDASARQAFEAGRRAILRCGINGFDLPEEKYDHWQTIEMVFNPEDMRLR